MSGTTFYIGCSSFATPSWKSVFYPDDLPKKDWFAYYSSHFTTYEYNGSFYRVPTVAALQKWYYKTPPGFQFSIKVPKMITHTKKLLDCADEISQFYAVCSQGLADKLACVLWQFPPSFVYGNDQLHRLLSALDTNFNNVVEFRHQSWWNNEVLQKLNEKNAVFCNPSYPGLPHEVIKNNNCGYFRLHGVPRLFYSEYSLSEIEALYEQILAKGYQRVFIYFNNTASPAAVVNALQFVALLNQQTV